MEWGLSNQFELFSNGQIRFDEIKCGEKQDAKLCLESLMARSNSYLVFYAPPFGNGPLWSTFKQVLAQLHIQDRPARVFYQRDGRPVYLVYESSP